MNWMKQKVVLEPAAAGISDLQNDYRRPLAALAVLVVLVLLIACANVANLMTAQAASRAREMALRVSIGAGRRRLVQLVLVESAWLAIFAAALGGVFAWWSAPLVVRMINPPDNPAHLTLPADWRVLGFGLALTIGVTLLFGLAPALRASAIKPVSALKGGEDPHSRRRLMHALVAVQTAFCFLVLFVAGLFVATFERLSHQPTGFSAERVLTLETVTARPQPPDYWDQVAEHLRALPGVETVALASSTLLGGWSWNNFISVNGAPPQRRVWPTCLSASPGWLDTMRIPLLDGRDFRPATPIPVSAIVNQTFAKQYFNGENPVGKSFEMVLGGGPRDSLSRSWAWSAMSATATCASPSCPRPIFRFALGRCQGCTGAQGSRAYVHRAHGEREPARDGVHPAPGSVARAARISRQQHPHPDGDQRVAHRARAAAGASGAFFAAVALLLAAVGLYGVLDYSVLQRRHEIGIRMALGAPAADIARHVTAGVFSMVLGGALGGLALGMAAARYIESLFYQVKPTDPAMLAVPALSSWPLPCWLHCRQPSGR